jgi:conjugative relaxase-like TrwC/TraI family protein
MWNAYKLKDGKNYLESHLTKGDYYSEDERVTGRWRGSLAARLGLSGEIAGDDRAFAMIFAGQRPDGGKLIQRKAKLSGIDFVASAPKSLSVASILDPRLRAAHERAVEASVADLERFAARRVRAFGRNENERTGGIVAAEFHHAVSRSLDPQIHTHLVVANATIGRDGRWYAMTEFEMFRAIRYLSRAYEARLAAEVMALGYDVEITREGGEVNEIRLVVEASLGRIRGVGLAGARSVEVCAQPMAPQRLLRF